LSPERPTQTAYRGSRRPDGCENEPSDSDDVVKVMSSHPSEDSGILVGDELEMDIIGKTASRRIRIDDDTNRGEAFARPDDVRGVIPGAVEVADYTLARIHIRMLHMPIPFLEYPMHVYPDEQLRSSK